MFSRVAAEARKRERTKEMEQARRAELHAQAIMREYAHQGVDARSVASVASDGRILPDISVYGGNQNDVSLSANEVRPASGVARAFAGYEPKLTNHDIMMRANSASPRGNMPRGTPTGYVRGTLQCPWIHLPVYEQTVW